MTSAEEDALVEKTMRMNEGGILIPIREAIRLAIRTAVAQERERCAKVCEGWYPGIDDDGEPVKLKAFLSQDDCAAAIRRG